MENIDFKKIGYWALFILVCLVLFKFLVVILGVVLNIILFVVLVLAAIYLYQKIKD